MKYLFPDFYLFSVSHCTHSSHVVLLQFTQHNMEQHMGGVGLRDSQHMVSGRRLLVKIVKGDGIRDAQNPYVVIEMDEPAQKNQTGTQRGGKPFWDEHFLL